MSHETGELHCTEEGCEATVRDHYWGRVKSGWFFSMQNPGQQWCPKHIPEWVAEWRAKRDGDMAEDVDVVPTEATNVVLAQGIWCEDCEVFEPDDIEKDTCPGCGHSRTTHVPVQVVAS